MSELTLTITPPSALSVNVNAGSNGSAALPPSPRSRPASLLAAAIDTENNNNNNSGMSSGASDFSDSGFVKTLSSDVGDNEALKLLLTLPPTMAQQYGGQTGANEEMAEFYRDFTLNDFQLLAQILSILVLKPNEKIISKGELATFCGIILSGTFLVTLPDKSQVQLRKRELVGEMSYFHINSVRNADISVHPSSEAVLAVITYSELQALTNSAPLVSAKFVKLLAAMAIKKLQTSLGLANGTVQPPAPSSGLLAVGGPSLGVSSAKSGARSARGSNIFQQALSPLTIPSTDAPTPSGPQSPTNSGAPNLSYLEANKLETFYRKRLNETKQKQKRIIETELSKRSSLESKIASLQEELAASHSRLSSVLADGEARRNEFVNSAAKLEQEIERLHQYLNRSQAEEARLQEKLALEKQATRAAEDQISQLLKSMQVRHTALTDKADNKNNMQAQSLIGAAPLSPTRVRDSPASSLWRRASALALKDSRKTQATAEMSANERVALAEARFEAMKKKYAALESSIQHLESVKDSSIMAARAWTVEKATMQARLANETMSKIEYRTDFRRCLKVLNRVVVTRTVKDHRLKARLLGLWGKSSQFVLDTFQTQLNYPIPEEGITAPRPSTAIAAVPASPSSPSPYLLGNFPAIRSVREFHAFRVSKQKALQRALANKKAATLAEIVGEVDSEFDELRQLTSMMARALGYFKRLSEDLFQRNIFLTQEKLGQVEKYSQLKIKYDDMQKEWRGLMEANQARAAQIEQVAIIRGKELNMMDRRKMKLAQEILAMEDILADKRRAEKELYFTARTIEDKIKYLQEREKKETKTIEPNKEEEKYAQTQALVETNNNNASTPALQPVPPTAPASAASPSSGASRLRSPSRADDSAQPLPAIAGASGVIRRIVGGGAQRSHGKANNAHRQH